MRTCTIFPLVFGLVGLSACFNKDVVIVDTGAEADADA